MTRRTHRPPDDAHQLHRQIVDALNRQRKAITLTRLASLLDLSEGDERFLDAVRQLRREGLIYAEGGARYASVSGMSARMGKINMSERGFGFVQPDDGGEEIHIPARKTADALDGDLVLVAPVRSRGREGLHAGRVLGVVERPSRPVVGTLHRGPGFSWVHPDDPVLPDIQVFGAASFGEEERVSDGDKVVAVLEPITLASTVPSARLERVLGSPADPWTDVQGIIYQYGLHEGYPADAEREAAALPPEVTPEDVRSRRDLRDLEIITIDPPDAADIDDAISLTYDPQGRAVVGVHIADVSRYVAMNEAIDREAARRGTSVYLPGRVLHMLPRKLSEKRCSLQPGEDRLTVSVFVTLDADAQPVGAEFVHSVIRSRAKLSYEDVQAVLDGREDGENPAKPFAEMLARLAAITARMTEHRLRNGALDFDVPEIKVEVDAEGHVVALHRRERLTSHRLIEELMLLANRTVAHHLAEHHYGLLYRVHAGPDPAKLREVAPLARAAGHLITPDGRAPTVRELQALLRDVEGQPVAPILETLIIRSLPKAVYQPDNIGHFGLATEEYAHFTSPIRRYPDLVVHRQLARLLAGEPPAYSPEQLGALGRAASEAEQKAEAAEREAIRAKQVEYLAAHLGEEFEGTISGVRKFGLFVMLNDSLAEGLVSVNDLDDDLYRYDPSTLSLTGRRHRRTYRFGDPVRVQVVKVDTAARQVDFLLVDAPESARKKKAERPSRKKDAASPARRSGRSSRPHERNHRARRRRR